MGQIVVLATIMLVATILAARLGKVPRTRLEVYAAIVSLIVVILLLVVVALKEDPFATELLGLQDLGRWIVLVPMCPLVYMFSVWFRLWRKRRTRTEAGCMALLVTIVAFIGVDGYTSAFLLSSIPDIDDTGRTIGALGPDGHLRSFYILLTLLGYIPLWWVLLPSRRREKE